MKIMETSRSILSLTNSFHKISTQFRHNICVQIQEEEQKSFSEIPQPSMLSSLKRFFYSSKQGFDTKFSYQHIKDRHGKLGSIYKETVIPGVTNPIVFCSSSKVSEQLFRLEERLPVRDGMEYLAKVRNKIGVHPGLVNIQGEEWHKIRKPVNEHMVSNEAVWRYTKKHLEVAEDFVDLIEKNLDDNNEIPDFGDMLNKWALEATGVFALHSRLGLFEEYANENVKSIMNYSNAMFKLFIKFNHKLPMWKYFNTKDLNALCALSALQYKAIESYRNDVLCTDFKGSSISKPTNLLNEQKLTFNEQNILVSDILSGGIYPTSSLATFILYCLATNLDKQEILRQEILKNSHENICGKKLQQMKYMHACHKEAQRLFPLVIGTARRYSEEVVACGYRIPPKTLIFLTSNIVNNTKSDYFANPQSFNPERWLHVASRNSCRFAMTGSFGYGPRVCPGRRFAIQEVNCLLVALLSRFKVEYHHEPFEVRFNLVSTPLQKLQFTFVPLK